MCLVKLARAARATPPRVQQARAGRSLALLLLWAVLLWPEVVAEAGRLSVLQLFVLSSEPEAAEEEVVVVKEQAQARELVPMSQEVVAGPRLREEEVEPRSGETLPASEKDCRARQSVPVSMGCPECPGWPGSAVL